MGKSVYSIVLADEVVEQIDRMAYEMNTSRSNLINQILAERVRCVTPEMRMREIFSAIEQLMDTKFRFLDCPSDTMIALKSPLRYKYKPTIRYSVELNRDFNGKAGRLKVALRTQSAGLIQAINGFFEMWVKIENVNLKNVFKNGVPCEHENEKYVRDFYAPNQSELSDEEIGNAIGEYITLMDSCIQIYFDNMDNKTKISNVINNKYLEYIKKGITIL